MLVILLRWIKRVVTKQSENKALNCPLYPNIQSSSTFGTIALPGNETIKISVEIQKKEIHELFFQHEM